MKTLTIKPSNPPWFLECAFPFNKQLKDFIKQYPGKQWSPEKKVWLLPVECKKYVIAEAERLGFTVKERL